MEYPQPKAKCQILNESEFVHFKTDVAPMGKDILKCNYIYVSVCLCLRLGFFNNTILAATGLCEGILNINEKKNCYTLPLL